MSLVEVEELYEKERGHRKKVQASDYGVYPYGSFHRRTSIE